MTCPEYPESELSDTAIFEPPLVNIPMRMARRSRTARHPGEKPDVATVRQALLGGCKLPVMRGVLSATRPANGIDHGR